MAIETAQTFLFVPGDRPERFDKASASGCDVVVIDLEDAVAADAKSGARAAAAEWCGRGGHGAIRVNAAGTAEHQEDLQACAGAAGAVAVVLPKAESPEDVDRVAEIVGPRLPVIALIESAKGLANAIALAEHPAVARLAFGNLDFAADCGMRPDAEELELMPVRVQLVVASRAARIVGPIDGVTQILRDHEVVLRSARRSVQMGFGGKLCIHPAQVAPVREAFQPSEAEVAWASQILAAVDGGVGVVDGNMVDRPVILRARAILARQKD